MNQCDATLPAMDADNPRDKLVSLTGKKSMRFLGKAHTRIAAPFVLQKSYGMQSPIG
jgi:hypothetical protein